MATTQVTARLPGFLEDVIGRRWKAMGYRGKSEYIIGLVLWDVYSRQTHTTTGALMGQSSWTMEKFVRGLIHDLGEPQPPPGDIIPYRFNVYVPEVLMPMVKQRAKEEGYRSGSAYIVSLVIYDLKQRDHEKKVPHHKTAEVMNLKDGARMMIYAHFALNFENPTRKWPKHLLP